MHQTAPVMRAAVLAYLVATAAACASTDEPAPPDDTELADLDAWATAADGKADLPGSWSELVAWLEDMYTNRMSAIWRNQEHPATADRAIARVRQLAQAGGIADPTRALYPMTVQRLRTELLDHSELNITVAPGKVIRLVGDPKGAGAFVDQKPFESSIGTRLCLTWTELQTAVRASYVSGAYGVDFVCHTVTERVLRALDAGTASYADQVRTYAAARWIWGPIAPSGNSQDPGDWAISRACPAR